MAIRQSVEDAHFQYFPHERIYANALNEAFDITFGGRHDEYSYWVASPKEGIKERFGFVQEILVLFSTHPQLDARLFGAISTLAGSKELRLRVDKFIYLVVHSGERRAAAELVAQYGDRAIIPIEASALKNPHRGDLFIRSILAEAVGGLDLFAVSSPITTDRTFFGREELVQRLAARALQSRESSGLFGLRKTGKTSVLFALQRKLQEQFIITEYIDCQSPGVHAMRWWQLLSDVSERVFKKTRIAFTASKFFGKNLIEADAARAFNADMQMVMNDGQTSILILFDEVEYITAGLSGALGRHWDTDFNPFWATIRSVQQESKGRLTFIVAGVNPSCVETPHFGALQNPIFQLAIPQYLEPLKREAVREMVKTLGRYGGLSFEEEVFTQLEAVYGGHPYLTRIACSQLWKSDQSANPLKARKITRGNLGPLRSEIQDRLANPIRDILLSLVWWYPEEYELLRILASGSDDDKTFVDEYLEGNSEKIRRFVKYGILREETNQFAIEDLREFLIRLGAKYKDEISPFARTEIPQDVVIEIPDIEILGKLFVQKTELESGMRRLIMMVLGVSVGFDSKALAQKLLESLPRRRERQRPEELFIGRTSKDVINDLYTLDLKAIVSRHWETFKPIFIDKARFEMNMDAINVARRVDSHTKSITQQEAEDFSNSYHWMRARMADTLSQIP